MRVHLLALAAALLAAPAAARADLELRLELFDGAGGAPASLSLGVPQLEAPGAPAFAAQKSGGGGLRVDPVLCLILGFIPGFGIGHLLAHSPQWPIWLVVDVLLAAFVWGPFFYWDTRPSYFPIFAVVVVLERIFEGLSAYKAAGGSPLLREGPGWNALSPTAVALPVGARGSPLH
ncbi:MAG TPA: hypothetical protein VFP65_23285 [Anaeromyxobacteraceae bacterium]|nr:hypothetical protein [Anaeromyxobacteraceae bacterium]